MEYFVLIVVSVSIGLIMRYSMPNRTEYGLLLAPAVALASCLIVWTIGLVIGLNADHFLLWLAALVIAGIVSFTVVKLLPGRRIAYHKQYLENLLQR